MLISVKTSVLMSTSVECIADEEIIENLITEKKVDTFLFSSKTAFDELCLEVVTELENQYPHIRRVYVGQNFHILMKATLRIFCKVTNIHIIPNG